jgi:uncharacterized membrane protein YjfL (UPF0719 family)
MARVWVDYLLAIGWGAVGAVSMALGLAILLKVFDWLTPIDEWEEVRKGNIAVAIILAADPCLGIAIGFASCLSRPPDSYEGHPSWTEWLDQRPVSQERSCWSRQRRSNMAQ